MSETYPKNTFEHTDAPMRLELIKIDSKIKYLEAWLSEIEKQINFESAENNDKNILLQATGITNQIDILNAERRKIYESLLSEESATITTESTDEVMNFGGQGSSSKPEIVVVQKAQPKSGSPSSTEQVVQSIGIVEQVNSKNTENIAVQIPQTDPTGQAIPFEGKGHNWEATNMSRTSSVNSGRGTQMNEAGNRNNNENNEVRRQRLENARRRILASLNRFKVNWKKVGLVGAIGLLTLALNQDRAPKSAFDPNSLHPGLASGISELSGDYENIYNSNLEIPSGDLDSTPIKFDESNLGTQIPDFGITDSNEAIAKPSLSNEEIDKILNSERWAPQEVKDMLGFSVGAQYVQLNGKEYLALVPKEKLTQEQREAFEKLRVSFLVTSSQGNTSEANAIFSREYGMWILTGEPDKRVFTSYVIGKPSTGEMKIGGEVRE